MLRAPDLERRSASDRASKLFAGPARNSRSTGDTAMKTIKVLILTFALAVTGFAYATANTQSSSGAHKMVKTTAACCAAGATCSKDGKACCKEGAECCKAGASCCASADGC